MYELLDRAKDALNGRYDIECELGSGGMAVVFLAHDCRFPRKVAVKVLKPSVAEAMGPARFLREVNITATLSHPGILPILDSGEADGLLYYVMPYVEGGSLRGLLNKSNQLEIDEVLRISAEVASALEAAHTHGIVHRDIKPENVLLHEGRPMLADFGIATAVDDAGFDVSTEFDVVLGTIPYMSPERCTGESRGDARSDVYGLGCLVYEMLLGETPFTGRDTSSLIARIISEAPRSMRVVRPTITKRLESVVLRSLAKVPADRQRSANRLADELIAASRRKGTPLLLKAAIALVMAAALAYGTTEGWARWGSRHGSTWFPLNELAVRITEEDPVEGNAWFARALARELTVALSMGQGLGVRSADAFAAFPRNYGLSEAARVLRVGTLVDGQVRYRDSRVFVDVALVETETSRIMGDVLRDSLPRGSERLLSERTAVRLSGELRQLLGVQVRLSHWAQETNSEAWEAVHRAQILRRDARRQADWRDSTRLAFDLLTRAESLLVRATDADRDWNEPALQQGWVAYDRVRVAEVGGAADVDTSTVLAWLDEGLVHAASLPDASRDRARVLELRGRLRHRIWDWTNAELPITVLEEVIADLTAALDLDPSLAGAWVALSPAYQDLGRFDAAANATREALEHDTWHDEVQKARNRMMFDALRAGEVEEATRHCQFGLIHYPANPLFMGCRLDILGRTGDSPDDVGAAWAILRTMEQRPELGELRKRWFYFRMLIATIAARAGLADSARAIIRSAEADSAAPAPPDAWRAQKAHFELLLGDTTRAIQLLAEYLQAKPQERQRVKEHPWFRSLNEHPEFLAITYIR